MPEVPDPSDKKALPDPNAWIYQAYSKLRAKIVETIEPLELYLATLKKYQTEYKLDKHQVIRVLDDDENPPEPTNLRADVIFH